MTLQATKTEKIIIGIGVVLLIGLIVLVCVLFTSHRYQKEQALQFQKVIAIQDSALKRESEARRQIVAFYDPIIATRTQEATVAVTKARSNKPYYEAAKQQIETISNTVQSYNDSALRRAFAEFY